MLIRYLSECGFDFLPAIDYEAEWEVVKPIVTQHPWLCSQGYFRSESEYLSCVRRQATHNVDRWNCKPYLDQVYRSKYWLGLLAPTRNLNRHHNSYGLKHFCEDWWKPEAYERYRSFPGYCVERSYVSNGSLILAAILLGWEFSDTHRGRILRPNVYFPFSEKSLRLLEPESYLF
jgi:hypothetical protein